MLALLDVKAMAACLALELVSMLAKNDFAAFQNDLACIELLHELVSEPWHAVKDSSSFGRCTRGTRDFVNHRKLLSPSDGFRAHGGESQIKLPERGQWQSEVRVTLEVALSGWLLRLPRMLQLHYALAGAESVYQ